MRGLSAFSCGKLKAFSAYCPEPSLIVRTPGAVLYEHPIHGIMNSRSWTRDSRAFPGFSLGGINIDLGRRFSPPGWIVSGGVKGMGKGFSATSFTVCGKLIFLFINNFCQYRNFLLSFS
jgi:hypothetical protein